MVVSKDIKLDEVEMMKLALVERLMGVCKRSFCKTLVIWALASSFRLYTKVTYSIERLDLFCDEKQRGYREATERGVDVGATGTVSSHGHQLSTLNESQPIFKRHVSFFQDEEHFFSKVGNSLGKVVACEKGWQEFEDRGIAKILVELDLWEGLIEDLELNGMGGFFDSFLTPIFAPSKLEG